MNCKDGLLSAQTIKILMSCMLFIGSAILSAKLAMSSMSKSGTPMIDPQFIDACAGSGANVIKYWPKLPVDMKIDDGVPSEARADIFAAAEIWNRAFKGIKLFNIQISKDEMPPVIDTLSRIHWVESNWEFKNSHLAMARWDADKGVMKEADIYLNFENHNFSFGQFPQFQKYDLQSLMLHEFGHVLGLCHVEDTVMNRTLDPNHLMREITTDIKEQVACLYQNLNPKLKRECRDLKSQILAEKEHVLDVNDKISAADQ